MEALGNAGMMMLVLFVVVALGYAARKFGLMDDEFDRRLSKLVIWVTCPGLILDSVLGNVWAYVTTAIRLIVVPAVVFLVGGLFITDAYVLSAITLVAAMPAALVGTMMCIVYGGDELTISQCMFLTTAFSVVTIPLVAMLVV